MAQFVTVDDRNFMRVVSVDAQTGAIQPVGAKHWLGVGDVAWMPDGKAIAFTAVASDVSQIWRLSYPAGDAQKFTNDLRNYSGTSVSGDGRSIAVTQRELDSHLWTLAVGSDSALARQISSGSGRNDGGSGLSWTPDGRIVYSSNTSNVADRWICNSDGTNVMPLSTGGGPNSGGSCRSTFQGTTWIPHIQKS